MASVLSIEWIPDSEEKLFPGHVRILDQTRLPSEVVFIDTVDLQEVWDAIKRLSVRGAPAIGIAAAMGVAAAVQQSDADSASEIISEVNRSADFLATSRPTAVNLFWALERMKRVAADNTSLSAQELKERLVAEAQAIRDEDAAMCRAIGEYGSTLLEDGYTVLTHCNAGGLATSELGTALAPIYIAKEQGKKIHVYVDETRPLLQGSRLTAWELDKAGIDATLICDNMAAHVMKERSVKAVLVGADRIAANGDTANKIGTYGLAVLARAHSVPFYVFAPTSTFDMNISDGSGIPIEERSGDEITCGFGKETAPRSTAVYCPAFDVTPAELISAIVCEKGIARDNFAETLAGFASAVSQ